MHLKTSVLLALAVMMTALPVLASQNRFDPRVDLNNLDWFDRGLYKAALPYQPCVNLKEFYAYADSNPFDDLDRININSYRQGLSYGDYLQLAAENPSDGITPDDFSRLEDLRCSAVSEYDQWAGTRPSYNRDDYYSLWGWSDERDFIERDGHYPVNDYYAPTQPGRLITSDGHGGFASWVSPEWFY